MLLDTTDGKIQLCVHSDSSSISLLGFQRGVYNTVDRTARARSFVNLFQDLLFYSISVESDENGGSLKNMKRLGISAILASFMFLLVFASPAFAVNFIAVDRCSTDNETMTTASAYSYPSYCSQNFIDFLNSTRNATTYLPYEIQNGTLGYTNVGKWISAVNEMQALAVVFTDAGQSYPTSARTFMQIKDRFWVSPRMSRYYSSTAYTYPIAFWSSDKETTYPGFDESYVGRDYLFQVPSYNYAGTDETFCAVHLDKLPAEDLVKLSAVCWITTRGAIYGGGAELYDTNGTLVSALSAAGGNAVELLIDSTRTYELRFPSTSYPGSPIVASISLADLGSRELKVTQDSTTRISVDLLGTGSDGIPYSVVSAFTTNLRVDFKALSPHSGTVLQSSINYISGNLYASPGPNWISSLPESSLVIESAMYGRRSILGNPDGTDFQLGTITKYDSNPAAIAAMMNCPSKVYFLANIPFDVFCPLVAALSSTIFQGEVSSRIPDVSTFNASLFRITSDISNQANGVTVKETISGVAVPTQFNYPSAIMLNRVFSTSTAKTYTATIHDIFDDTHTANFPISYIRVTNVTNVTNATQFLNHRAIFQSVLTNNSGDFDSLNNFTVTIANSTSCTTQYSYVTIGNSSVRVATCSLYVPNRLQELETVYTYYDSVTNSTYSLALNQTYFGFYSTDALAVYGVNAYDYASFYYLTYNPEAATFIVTLEPETCNEPQVSKIYEGQSQRCKLYGCPVSHDYSLVERVAIEPDSYTCISGRQVFCKKDSLTNRYYKGSCTPNCGLSLSFCVLNACNSDSSGCSGDLTLQEQTEQVGLTGFFAASPASDFMLNKHLDFTIGLILIIGVSAFAASQIGIAFASLIGGFLTLGLILLTVPSGFLILLLVGAIVLIFYLVKLFGGDQGIQLR
jgi:hypothetical protein